MPGPVDYRVISIGTLAAHPLWDEGADVRSGHATTTLVTSGETRLLIDPGLPPAALAARLNERSGIQPHDVTHVFLTSFSSEHARGLALFEHATWLMSEAALQLALAQAHEHLVEAQAGGDEELAQHYERDLALLRRFEPAPDQIAPHVDLFPLPGVSPGTCGILLALPRMTVLICGDAVPTVEHLEQGKVLPNAYDVAQAQESFSEAVEIADVLVLGRDNLALNPLRRSGM